MKSIIPVLMIVTPGFLFASSNGNPQLQSCHKHLGDIRVCTDITPLKDAAECTNTINSGELWVDEISNEALHEMYTSDPSFCELLTDTVPFVGRNGSQAKTYCCGG